MARPLCHPLPVCFSFVILLESFVFLFTHQCLYFQCRFSPALSLHRSHQFTKGLIPFLDDYGALEPSISGKIMELHHKGHHNAYVTGYNTAIEKLQEAQHENDIAAQIALKPLINFNGGGHLNHTLFWENLAPTSSGGGEPPSGALAKAIDEAYGSFDDFKAKFVTALMSIQGSGWAWLVKDTETGRIVIKTYAVSGRHRSNSSGNLPAGK